MKFGIREVTDIVFKTKFANQAVGTTVVGVTYTPIMIIDSAKMSTLENAVSTVYAQGGKGNPRLLAWDGDRTATFKFEEAIITTDGLGVLSGSGIATGTTYLFRQQHAFKVSDTATQATFIPTIPTGATLVEAPNNGTVWGNGPTFFSLIGLDVTGDITGVTRGTTTGGFGANGATVTLATGIYTISLTGITGASMGNPASYVLDFPVATSGKQLQVEAGKFAGYYYVEANTLFRDMLGQDHPAQITIPKAKVKSNFTLTMSPTGDPSTFAFEIDCLPDYTNFISTKKVLYTVDIADTSSNELT